MNTQKSKLSSIDQFLSNNKKINPNSIKRVFAYLKCLLLKLEGQDYIYWLRYLGKLMSRGYSQLLHGETALQKKLVLMFNITFENFEIDQSDRTMSYLLFQISILADFLKHNPKYSFPYDRKFIQNTLSLERILKNQQLQGKMISILSVLYFNFSQNSFLFKNQNLSEIVKESIMKLLKTIQSEQQGNILIRALTNLKKNNEKTQKICEFKQKQCPLKSKKSQNTDKQKSIKENQDFKSQTNLLKNIGQIMHLQQPIICETDAQIL